MTTPCWGRRWVRGGGGTAGGGGGVALIWLYGGRVGDEDAAGDRYLYCVADMHTNSAPCC